MGEASPKRDTFFRLKLLVLSVEVIRRGLAFSTPTPVVQRAMFWCSRQSIDLISHSVKILIYPTLNYIDISSYFPVKRNESHLMEPPFSFSCVYEGLTQPRIRWILISRRNIPLRHLCETWQTGSFPRLHSFDELFKSQSRDSFLPRNGQNLSLKMGNTKSHNT